MTQEVPEQLQQASRPVKPETFDAPTEAPVQGQNKPDPEKDVEAGPQPGPTDPEAPNLTIQDLKVAMQMITVISARGAFQPGELALVGALYNKLHAFLDASGALAPAGENATTADPAAPVGRSAA